MQKTFNVMAGLLLCAVALFTASCAQSGGELLDRMPTQSWMTIVIDGDVILQSAGCEIDKDGNVELSAELSSLMRMVPNSLRQILQSNAIDRQAIGISSMLQLEGLEGMSAAIVIGIKDEGQFEKQMKDMGFNKVSGANGWTKLVDDHGTVLGLYEGFLYAVIADGEMPNGLDNAMLYAEAAKKESVGKISGIASQLEKPHAIAIAMNNQYISPEMRQMMMDKYQGVLKENMQKIMDGICCMTMHLDGPLMSVESLTLNADGSPLNAPAEDFKDINTDFLRYMDASQFCVGAAGVSGNINWKGYLDMMANMMRLGSSDRAMLDDCAKYLSMVDGTVAIGFGINNIEVNKLQDVAFTLTAELKPGKNQEVMAEIVDYCKENSLTVQQQGSEYVVSFTKVQYDYDPETYDYRPVGSYENKFYLSAPDNDLIVSFAPVKAYDNSIFKAADFQNAYAAMQAELPKASPVLQEFNVPFGIDAEGRMQENTATFTVKLTDTQKPFLQALLGLM